MPWVKWLPSRAGSAAVGTSSRPDPRDASSRGGARSRRGRASTRERCAAPAPPVPAEPAEAADRRGSRARTGRATMKPERTKKTWTPACSWATNACSAGRVGQPEDRARAGRARSSRRRRASRPSRGGGARRGAGTPERRRSPVGSRVRTGPHRSPVDDGGELVDELVAEQRRPHVGRDAVDALDEPGPARWRTAVGPSRPAGHLERQTRRPRGGGPRSRAAGDEQLEAPAGEEPQVARVEDAAAVVVEPAARDPQARVPVRRSSARWSRRARRARAGRGCRASSSSGRRTCSSTSAASTTS